MICDICKNLNTDKGQLPCSMCEHRPHDLCTRNRFEPIEPKLLTAEQIVKQHRMHRDFRDVLSDGALITLSENSIKNGQIKEWNRLKPLIDAAYQSGPRSLAMDKAMEDITPPWEIKE